MLKSLMVINMAMVEEIGALKDTIRDLEDIKNNNPYQKVIFIAPKIKPCILIN